jgi:hypothetical protein
VFARRPSEEAEVIIDCDACEVRGDACGECVIGVLLGAPGAGAGGPVLPAVEVPSGAPVVQFDAPERRALDVLADQGLVPRLRLVPRPTRPVTPDAGATGADRHVG